MQERNPTISPVVPVRMFPMMPCKVCLLPHEEEMHAATLRVKAALRERLDMILGKRIFVGRVSRNKPSTESRMGIKPRGAPRIRREEE